MAAERPFLDQVAASLPQGWRVEPPGEEPWIEVSPEDLELPAQGWKLHVSATTGSAATVLRRAVPVLVEHRTAFKVVAGPGELDALNAAEAGVWQIGKFITAYPQDDQRAVRLAAALDQATDGLPGPPVPSDRPLHPGSLVHYRYGAFEERIVVDPSGRHVPAIEAPGGELIPDARTENGASPEWAEDPFLTAGVAVRASSRAVAGRYAVLATLHRSPRGAVHLAADLERSRPCVLKEAWPHAAVGPDGRDARDHLRWEAEVLERLSPDPRFPAPFELVEDADRLYLAMERVEGRTLSRYVGGLRAQERFVPEVQVVAWGRELAETLGTMHATGLAYRDLTSTNVVVGERLRIVDLELSAQLGASDAPAGGTAGYASPQQAAGQAPSVADDVHALGGILYFLATGAEPAEAPRPFHLLDRPVRTLNPSIDGALADVIARCLDPAPARRYESMDAAEEALRRVPEPSLEDGRPPAPRWPNRTREAE